MTDYRKYYEEFYGIQWNRDKYEIHHIDGNRKNNDIKNLILLPKELHRELHATLMGVARLTPNAEKITLEQAVKDYMKAELNGYMDWDIGVAIPAIMDVIIKCRRWSGLKNLGYNQMTFIDD